MDYLTTQLNRTTEDAGEFDLLQNRNIASLLPVAIGQRIRAGRGGMCRPPRVVRRVRASEWQAKFSEPTAARMPGVCRRTAALMPEQKSSPIHKLTGRSAERSQLRLMFRCFVTTHHIQK